MPKNTMITMLLVFAAILLQSCASAVERQAFADLAELERTPFAAGGDTYSKSQLPELNTDSTLSDYVAYAALNNPGLEAAFNKWKAALEKVPQARSLPDPRLSYSYFIREVETRVGPQRDRIALTQMFPWFGKLDLRGKAALAAAEAARYHYEAEKLRLFQKVKDAYYEYYYLSTAIKITRKNVELVRRLEGVVRAKYTVGKTPHSDLMKVQIALASLEDRLKSLNEFRVPLAAKLNAVLGRAPGKPIEWPKALPDAKLEVTDDDLFALLREHNPGLKAIAAMAEKEKHAADLARKERYPDITLGAQYVHTRPPHGTRPEDAGKDPWAATLSLNIPIWTRKYKAAENEAKARHRSALKGRADKENRLASDLKMALYRFRDSERKIRLYKENLIPKSRQALGVAEQAFTAGKASYLDLIDAQRTLLEFELSYERATADRAKWIAEIEALVGRDLRKAVRADNDD